MPVFLEKKLRAEYPNKPSAVYATLNAIGAMKGSKETAKGRAMQAQHNRDAKAGRAQGMAQGGIVDRRPLAGKMPVPKDHPNNAPRKMHANSMKNLTAPKFRKGGR